jgi:phage baseplate assembly protein V
MFDRLARKVGQIVGFGKAAMVDDSGAQQAWQVQVFVGGEDGLEQILDKLTRLGEYGFFSVPPPQAECVIIYPDGERSGGIIVATGHRASRPKNLKSGEAGVYNGLTGALFRMGEDGTAYLNCNLVLTNGANLTVAGDITDQTGSGNAKTVKNLRDDYNAHTHTDPQGGTVGPANPKCQ